MTTRREFLTATTGLAAAALTSNAEAQGVAGLAQSGLVGQLQGSQVVVDPARMPRSFKEAPELPRSSSKAACRPSRSACQRSRWCCSP